MNNEDQELNMSVGRICIREVDIIAETEPALTAARRMNERNVGTLVVVDGETRPVGIVSDRDLVLRVLAAGKDAAKTAVSDAMTPAPKVITESTPIEDALKLMRAGKFRRVPIVDSKGALVGLLSLDDILDLLAEEFVEIGQLIRKEHPTNLGRLPA
jgi:CBS domain-containing protein